MKVPTRFVASIVALLFVSSCTPDSPDTDGGSALSLDRDAAIAAAVDVRADGCGPRVGFGTGSVVLTTAVTTGLVVTAAHVVAGATGVTVSDVEGRETTATPVYFDPELDIAVLAPATPIGTPLPIRADGARRDETGVVVLPRRTEGVVDVEVAEVRVLRTANINTTDIYLERTVVRPGFELEGAIERGDSGAVVVLPGGGVGVVWARSQRNDDRAWAVDLPPTVLTLDASARTVDVGRCLRE